MPTELKKSANSQRAKSVTRKAATSDSRPAPRRRKSADASPPTEAETNSANATEIRSEPTSSQPLEPNQRPVNECSGDNRSTDELSPGGSDQTPQEAPPAGIPTEGILELHPDGYGFLRDATNDCLPSPDDAHVPSRLAHRLHLLPGDMVRGSMQPPARKGQGPRLVAVASVEGQLLEERPQRRDFNTLTPVNPDDWLRLETSRDVVTTRVIDLMAPLGRGQRGLIVAPPRSGKTILLQHIGQAVAANHPEVQVVVLLVDERPEEVTDMRRGIPGQVFASSLDQGPERHVRLSRLVIERCKRLVESGQHVLLLIDSITRISRAFNKWVGNTGRTMSGGVDINALEVPRRIFASARAFEEGGSLTILATALVETGSRMDDVIFEEFKGAGNMELTLDRNLAERRVWPAIDIQRSGTRREEKILDPGTLHATTALRRVLNTMRPLEAMEHLTSQLLKYNSNREFLAAIRHRLPD